MVEIIIIVGLAVWHVTSTCVDIRFSREFISASLINTCFPLQGGKREGDIM